jgi:hypothetical protein
VFLQSIQSSFTLLQRERTAANLQFRSIFLM